MASKSISPAESFVTEHNAASPNSLQSTLTVHMSLNSTTVSSENSLLDKLKKEASDLINICAAYVSTPECKPMESVPMETCCVEIHVASLRCRKVNPHHDEPSLPLHYDAKKWFISDRKTIGSCPTRKPLTFLCPDSFFALFDFAARYLEKNPITLSNGRYSGYRLALKVWSISDPKETKFLNAVLDPVVPSCPKIANTTPILSFGACLDPPHTGGDVATFANVSSRLDFEATLVVQQLIQQCEMVKLADKNQPYRLEFKIDGTILFHSHCVLARSKKVIIGDLVHASSSRTPQEWFFDGEGYRITGPISKLVTPRSFRFLFAHITKSLTHSPPIILKHGDLKGCALTIVTDLNCNDKVVVIYCVLSPPSTKIVY